MPRKKVTLNVDGEKVVIKDQKGSAEQALEKVREKKTREQFYVNMRFLGLAAMSVLAFLIYVGILFKFPRMLDNPVFILTFVAVHVAQFYLQYMLYGIRMPKSQMQPKQHHFFEDVARLINNLAVLQLFTLPITLIIGIATSIYCSVVN